MERKLGVVSGVRSREYARRAPSVVCGTKGVMGQKMCPVKNRVSRSLA